MNRPENRFTAPCGHPGEPIIGTFVRCLTPGCDGQSIGNTVRLMIDGEFVARLSYKGPGAYDFGKISRSGMAIVVVVDSKSTSTAYNFNLCIAAGDHFSFRIEEPEPVLQR